VKLIIGFGFEGDFTRSNNIFGVNINNDSLMVISRFLHFCIDQFPFIFLAILMNVNPKRVDT